MIQKLLIGGSRDFTNHQLMLEVLLDLVHERRLSKDATLICGMARGADMVAHDLFTEFQNPIVEMPADWNTHGKSAGFIRNQEMGQLCDGALLFWDGVSPGTKHMMRYMIQTGKPLYMVTARNWQKPEYKSYNVED